MPIDVNTSRQADLDKPQMKDISMVQSRDRILDIGKETCLLYTSPSPRDRQKSRMPSSA